MSEERDQATFLKRFLPVETALRGYLLAVTRNPVETDELFQDVAVTLWRKFGDFDETRSFRAWAMGVASLEVLKRRQAFARSRIVFSDELVGQLAATAGDGADHEDFRRVHLASCIRKLPEKERTVVGMRFEMDLSLGEIASRIGKSVGAVEMMMVRIRRWLRACVEKSMALENRGIP